MNSRIQVIVGMPAMRGCRRAVRGEEGRGSPPVRDGVAVLGKWGANL